MRCQRPATATSGWKWNQFSTDGRFASNQWLYWDYVIEYPISSTSLPCIDTIVCFTHSITFDNICLSYTDQPESNLWLHDHCAFCAISAITCGLALICYARSAICAISGSLLVHIGYVGYATYFSEIFLLIFAYFYYYAYFFAFSAIFGSTSFSFFLMFAYCGTVYIILCFFGYLTYVPIWTIFDQNKKFKIFTRTKLVDKCMGVIVCLMLCMDGI